MGKGGFRNLYNTALDTINHCLGEPVIYHRIRSDEKFRVNGIFSDRAVYIDPDTEELIASNEPQCFIKLADIPYEPEEKDELEICGECYRIFDAREDGLGGTLLRLHKINDD